MIERQLDAHIGFRFFTERLGFPFASRRVNLSLTPIGDGDGSVVNYCRR